jgi:hypothetical protein
MDDHQRFQRAVDDWILAAARSSASFDDLLCGLPGVYPPDVTAGLDRLEEKHQLTEPLARRLRRRAPQARAVAPEAQHLPVPHPLDFDWRFAPGALDRLVAECENCARGDLVVLLGAPSVLCALESRGSVPALLLDANKAIVDVFAADGPHSAALCDFGSDAIPAVVASVVVIDPPWYCDHEGLFLWAASRFCREGTTVLVSMPAAGTRPGAVEETESALAAARTWGLEVAWREPGALPYLSPPFERNALAAAGFRALPEDWRRGDLVALAATGGPRGDRPAVAACSRWPEVAIGRVRIRVRPRADEHHGYLASPALRSIVPGDVLDSVSRRDPRRDAVDVWTSGNRVFACASPRTLLLLLESLAQSRSPERAIAEALGRALTPSEMRRIKATVQQVISLIATEADELSALGWAA